MWGGGYDASKPVHQDCACCGGPAGRWLQWHNQDYEYGCCKSCMEWMVNDERETPESINDLYGKPGVHRAKCSFDKEQADA